MLKAHLELNPDYFLYYVITENGERVGAGGLTRAYVFHREFGAYAELLLRATINLVMDGPFGEVFADDSFEMDLTPFGFTRTKTGYAAHRDGLKLPHFCSHAH